MEYCPIIDDVVYEMMKVGPIDFIDLLTKEIFMRHLESEMSQELYITEHCLLHESLFSHQI